MYYIGIDLGGTHICVGLVNADGKLIEKLSVPAFRERPFTAMVEDMARLIDELMEKNSISQKEIASIGMGTPGLIDRQKGLVIYSCNLNMENADVRTEMKKYFDVPVYIENDANCAALGENTCGAVQGCKNSITITIGTGLGAGIIINNKIYVGSFGGGSELGHMVISADGEECGCGRKGCLEAYTSATAIIREGRCAAAKYPDSLLFEDVGGDIKQIDAKFIFDTAQKGDYHAIRIVNKFYDYLSTGIANIINIFEPEMIAIGGGVSAQGQSLINSLNERVEKLVYGGVLKTKIVTAGLGNDAGIIGAAMLGKD